MAMTVHCDVVSAEQSMFSGLVELVVAAGTMGDVGIAPGHAAMLTELKPGPVMVRKQNGEEELFYVGGGFLEVQPNVITVLADSALRAADVDEAKAQEAAREAEKAMANQSSEFDYTKASLQLSEAAAQLRTIEQLRKGRVR